MCFRCQEKSSTMLSLPLHCCLYHCISGYKIYSKAIHEQKPKGQNATTKTFEALLDNRTRYNSKIPAQVSQA
jgi:hypothetical protein